MKRKPSASDNPGNQGEGDRASAARYNEDQRQFVQQNDADKREALARKAAPADAREASELQQAEDTGRAHSKAGDESDEMLKDSPKAAPRGGGDLPDERDNPAAGSEGSEPARGSREARGRDDPAGARRRGRFLRRRR